MCFPLSTHRCLYMFLFLQTKIRLKSLSKINPVKIFNRKLKKPLFTEWLFADKIRLFLFNDITQLKSFDDSTIALNIFFV